MEKIDPNIFGEAKNTSAMAGGGCGTCQRNGMPFFLVRQSVINPNAYHGIDWSENVPKLADRRPNVALTKHKYALRMLRKGYVYVLMEQNGIRKLLGYEVTSKGALRHRSIYHMKKYEIEDLAEKCTEKNHNIPAIFANIDVLNATVWIAYSRRAWSKDIEDYYRSPDADLRRFTQVTINDKTRNNPTDLTDGRSFAFNDLLDKNKAPYLPEFFFDKKDFNVRFPSAHEFYDYSDKDNLNAIANIAAKFEKQYQCTIGCIVLEDTFGIAEELNAQRFRNFDPINNAFLEHEREIEKKLTDAYNEKIADYTPSDNWLNASDELPQLFPYAKDYFQSLINPNIDDNQSDTAQSQAITVPLRPNTNTSKYYHKYFSTTRAYKRRIVSCIDAYKKGLKNYFANQIEQENEKDGKYNETQYEDVYKPVTNMSNNSGNELYAYSLRIQKLQSEGWKEVTLTDEEKTVLLKQKNQSQIPYNNYVDVHRFSLTKEGAVQSKFDKEWAKLSARLDKGKLGAFRQEEKQLFDEIVKDIRKISIDYLVYVTWLFGSKDKPSKYAPAGLTNYNQVEFWKREQENDYSKDHLGYFEDITTILQGNITMAKLPEQFGLWDSLLRDENSIYFYLLKGQDNNLYEGLLKQRIVEMEQNQNAANHKTKVTTLNELVDKINAIMDLPIDAKNTTLFVDKMEVLMSWAAAGVANRPDSAKLINEVLMKDHSIEKLKIFSGIEYRRIKIPVKIKDVPKVYELMMEKTEVSSFSFYKDSKLYKIIKESGSQNKWKFESDVTKKNLEKTIKMEFMVVADDIASMDSMIEALNKSKNLNETTINNTKEVLGAKIIHAHEFEGITTIDELITAYGHVKRRIMIGEAKTVFINGIMIGLQGYMVYQNVQLLIEQGRDLRKDIIEQILSEIATTCVTLSLLSADLIGHFIKMAGSFPTKNIFTTMVPGTTVFLKFTGSALALFAIADGVSAILKGICFWQSGEKMDGGSVLLGGMLTAISGVISLYGAISSLSLTFAIVGIVLAIIGVILIFLFSASDNWSPMEIWFNRCYFGKQKHQEKGQPYPLTAVGASAALNDYFAYISGAYLELFFQRSDVEFVDWDDVYKNSEKEGGVLIDYRGGLRVHLNLPGFNEHSRYICIVYLTDRDGNSGKVRIEKGKDQQNVHVTVYPNQCNEKLVKWVKSKDYPINSSVSNNATDTNSIASSNGITKIEQKVAELRYKEKQVIGILHYWQDKSAKSPLHIEYKL